MLAVLALKWREDKASLDQGDRERLQTFMQVNSVRSTPQYKIFIDHYTAGSGPIALAIAQGTAYQEAITEQLGAESQGVASDCSAAAG
ncbi:hypothetical protein ABT246_25765 [Streptomyces sp. NPDC001553]|uniref:hypothetical protein n=1 Tax=Streptomyces sp. NPDC001553 TaxID=3154385 RepID=UPI00331C3C9F